MFPLLNQEEYPNPCDSIFSRQIIYFMDLGEVVKMKHILPITTPSSCSFFTKIHTPQESTPPESGGETFHN
jgi:hypothetical protein